MVKQNIVFLLQWAQHFLQSLLSLNGRIKEFLVELKIIFNLLVLFTIVQRLFELRHAKKNEKKVLSQGGFLIPEKNYFFMVGLHSLWLFSLLLIGVFNIFERDFSFSLFFVGLTLFLIGQSLRIIAIKTLGERWSTRILSLPNAPVINNGIFKYLKHPNYLGVIFEIFALPVMLGLWDVAIVFSLLNLVILYFRIKQEEKGLTDFNNYRDAFGIGS